MTSRKGNLMGVRDDIKVLDATIRDGGLCNNFDFSDEFVTELYKTNIKSGVDYMEFGYKASKEMFNVKEFGKWKFCDEESIRGIVGENNTDLKIAVMADVGRTDFRKDIIPRSESHKRRKKTFQKMPAVPIQYYYGNPFHHFVNFACKDIKYYF